MSLWSRIGSGCSWAHKKFVSKIPNATGYLVAAIKAVGMALSTYSLFGAKPNEMPKQLQEGDPKAYLILISAVTYWGLLIYMKYNQTQIKVTNSDDAGQTEPLILTPKSNKDHLRFAMRSIAGVTFIVADVSLTVFSINKYLPNATARIIINVLGVLPAAIQDTRLALGSMPSKLLPQWAKNTYHLLDMFQGTKVGKVVETTAVAYRLTGAKLGLYQTLFKTDSVLVSHISEAVKYTLVLNPFSFYCKWSNYQSEVDLSHLNSKALKVAAGGYALVFTPSYTLEDSAQYVMGALGAFNQQTSSYALVMTLIMFGLEDVAYARKVYETSMLAVDNTRKAPNKIKDKFKCCRRDSIFNDRSGYDSFKDSSTPQHSSARSDRLDVKYQKDLCCV